MVLQRNICIVCVRSACVHRQDQGPVGCRSRNFNAESVSMIEVVYKEQFMRFKLPALAIAVTLTLSAVGTRADQQFGRESVPGQTVTNVTNQSEPNRFGRDSVYASSAAVASSSRTVVVGAQLSRYGRDSVYATQPPTPPAPVTATAPATEHFGRDSVYAPM